VRPAAGMHASLATAFTSPAVASRHLLRVLSLVCSKWDEVMAFVDASGLDMVFGLNAAIGRQTSSPPVWNASNIIELLTYVRDKGHHLPVVECGNEVSLVDGAGASDTVHTRKTQEPPSRRLPRLQVNVFNCSGAGNVANMTAGQLAAEYTTLASLVKQIMPGTAIWGTDSSITGDIAGQCHSWYGDDLLGFNRDWLADPLQPAQFVSALTWHWYPQSSANATSGIAQMLTYEYQTRLVPYVHQMRQMADAYAPGVPLVMGETASYWAGGLANVSNRCALSVFVACDRWTARIARPRCLEHHALSPGPAGMPVDSGTCSSPASSQPVATACRSGRTSPAQPTGSWT